MKFKDALKRSVEMFESDDFKQRIREEDDTMVKYITILKEINKHGYITFDSQAGRCRKGKKSYFDSKPYEIKERAYMIGFMKKDIAEKFIKQMGINTDKNALYVPICGDNIEIPRALDIPLTITINEKETVVSTHTSAVIPQSYANFIKKQVKLSKSEDAVCIVCWDTKWCRSAGDKNGLFTEVLTTLKNIK
jgi:hypothetical protein